MANEIFDQKYGVFLGRTLLQQRGKIGGNRFVFVVLNGNKNELVFPTTGGVVKNPFKAGGKMYAGDLIEYRYNGGTTNGSDEAVCLLLKTFEVVGTVEAAGTTVNIRRNGYRHIPEVGNILMKAPDTLAGTGTAATVQSVEKTKVGSDDVWAITLSEAIGTLSDKDVLVEAAEAGADKKMLVQNPNTMCPCDYDFPYTANDLDDEDDYDGARYLLTPVLHGIAYVSRMSPMPKAVLARNKSLVTGWFEL